MSPPQYSDSLSVSHPTGKQCIAGVLLPVAEGSRLPPGGPARPGPTAIPNVTRFTFPSPMLDTTREVEGYDGKRGDIEWWFESWGRGSRKQWTTRDRNGRPPT